MTMINAGYSKNEIDAICNERLKDPMCCCAQAHYKPHIVWQGDRAKAKYEKTTYVWKKADNCSDFEQKSNNGGWLEYYVEGKCYTASQCGR